MSKNEYRDKLPEGDRGQYEGLTFAVYNWLEMISCMLEDKTLIYKREREQHRLDQIKAENEKQATKKGVSGMAKQAYLFPHPTIEELCESLNELLVDNQEWILTNVDIVKHEDGTYTGILDYLEPLEG